MSKQVRHHYVPQTYLNSFDCASRKQPHVYVLSVSDGRIFDAAVGDVALENNFYTLHRNNNQRTQEEKLAWENHYARNIEPHFGSIIRQLLKTCNSVLVQDNAIVLNKNQKEVLTSQLLAQLLRGKIARSFTKNIYREQLPIVTENVKRFIPPTDTKKLQLLKDFETNEDYFLETSMQAILLGTHNNRFQDVMRERIFIVYRVLRNPLFVTSDHPVAFIDTTTNIATPFTNGLLYPSTVVIFPLSPNLLLNALTQRTH